MSKGCRPAGADRAPGRTAGRWRRAYQERGSGVRILLVAGKGGVGKTTLAAATAARLTAEGRKALVVSSDPAHSLGDVLDVRLGPDPLEVDSGLWAAEVDGRALLGGAWERARSHVATVLAGAGVDELAAEELTAVPGLEELLALSQVHRLAGTGPWDVVVVDCAPTAESLRLLTLPEAAAHYLERLFPTHRRVVRGMLAGIAGGAGSVQRWDATADALGRLAERLAALRAVLADPRTTSLRLVLTPERVVAAETRRAVTALALQGIRVDGLVANRLLPGPDGPDEGTGRGAAAVWLRTRRAEQDAVLDGLRRDLPWLPLQCVAHRAAEPVGLPALLELARELVDPDRPAAGTAPQVLSVRRESGRGLDSEYVLRLAVPLFGDGDVQLARIDDELAVTAAGHRRLVPLPSVLRRCTAVRAEIDDVGLLVRFRPDPALWMR